MGCWHDRYDRHGCGPWHGAAYDRGWYEPIDSYADLDWPARRARRRLRRPEREADVEGLEARLDDLREEIRRVEEELGGLRSARQETEVPG